MPNSSAPAVRRHRARLRDKGLRPVQIWLPDTSTSEFKAQAAHDIAALTRPAPEEDALLDAYERMDAEDLRE